MGIRKRFNRGLMRQILKRGDMVKFTRTHRIGIVLEVNTNIYEPGWTDSIDEIATIIDETGKISTKAVHYIGIRDCKLISFGLDGIEIV